MNEKQVSLQIHILMMTMCLHMCMYTHVYACIRMHAELYVQKIASKSLVYSQALNMFTLARFHLEFENNFVVNNRWHKVALK